MGAFAPGRSRPSLRTTLALCSALALVGLAAVPFAASAQTANDRTKRDPQRQDARRGRRARAELRTPTP